MDNSSSLKDVEIEIQYDPAKDKEDVVKKFYIPCLKASVKYDRITAYFNSMILTKFSEGLSEFYRHNHGHIRFVFSDQITDEEMNSIQDSYKKRLDKMADELEKNEDYLANDFDLANLAYLIENGLAEVKIAFMLNEESSLCHIKAGLFEDEEGNRVYFNGSGNETINGIERNAEIFSTFKSVLSEPIPRLDDYVEKGVKLINSIWDNTYSPTTVWTTYPEGRLFEKLKSYSRKRFFENKREFYGEINSVLIDIDEDSSSIYLDDYTEKHQLSVPMALSNYIGKTWQKLGEDRYRINELNVHVIRDIIVNRLTKIGIRCAFTRRAKLFLDDNDNETERRKSLALAIKEDREKELWSNSYYSFKKVVDEATAIPLRDQQMKNAFFHYCMRSSANYSVPGTGKTFISYGLFAYLSSKEAGSPCDKIVVLGPLNCFKAWKDEGKKIFGSKRELSFFDITEHRSDWKKQLKTYSYDVYLFNYDFFISNIDAKSKAIQERLFGPRTLVILDEIHKLKSLDGVKANNIKSLFKYAKRKPIYKLALTGTPLPNSFRDLWNYLEILYPDDLYTTFSAITLNTLSQADESPYKAREITQALAPTFMRTTKKDLEVPPPEPDDLDSLAANPTAAEQELYESIWKFTDNPLVKFIRLIQAASNPQLLKKRIAFDQIKNLFNDDFGENQDDDVFEDFGKQADPDSFVNPPKRQFELIDSIGTASKTRLALNKITSLVKQGKKVLVWCLFIDTIYLVKDYLDALGIRTTNIYGADDIKARESKIEEFKTGYSSVLITNPNTLAESVSLHEVCHDAVYLEYGFNLTYMLQSKDRINRVGLPEGTKTNYYYAIAEQPYESLGSIDRRIIDRLEVKAKRMLSAIESNELVVSGDHSKLYDDIIYILNRH